MNTKLILTSLALLSLTACGSVPKRTFTIEAIDNDDYRKPWPCLVVVDGDWAGAAQRKQFINLNGNEPLQLELTFDQPKHQVEVVPVRVVNGEVNKVPLTELESLAETDRRLERRELFAGDAEKQKFVISR